ncbi:3-dehydroquinate synthase [Cytophagales bacterium LB-30]|uniref:3-dehydroquinate synthase n=1 Tax=Shiella aurantiaca TaxID=3058365 RepID=A0ABT8F7T3_9BACT|nr:3-dehydroquinate synthase [Shiella aurantiaca]MDN4166502.1 3-dehydroquinate synthase [Shiella aurantiaca]
MKQPIQVSAPWRDLARFITQLQPDKLAVLVDENTHALCYPIIKEYFPAHKLIQISSGEIHKTIETCSSIWQALTDAQFSRHSLLVNLGGGVIGDMGGFCASTYKRGIRFINIPTTLLAQVDASVGGKLGIDFGGFKNQIGVFQIPDLVFAHPVFLKSLPEAELRSGFAEVIKHALISDTAWWNELSQKAWQNQDWEKHIRLSIALKERITTEDPTEKGIRKVLNFGHTLGHAIESLLLNTERKLLHGEAIAVGMVLASLLSQKKAGLSEAEGIAIRQYIASQFSLPRFSEEEIRQIIALAHQDKKNQQGIIKMVLLEGIGKPVFDIAVSEQEIAEVFQ